MFSHFAAFGLSNTVSIIIRIVIVIIAVVVIQKIVRHFLGRIVDRALRRHKYSSPSEQQKRKDTLVDTFGTLSGVILWIIAIIYILSLLHINLAALVTGAGAIAVVLGLGAQSVIGNYLAGILIILENQYRIGDIVGLTAGSEVIGTVEDIDLRVTKLRDIDGNLIIVPNGETSVVTNMSFKYAQVHFNIHITYDADLNKAIKLINETGIELAGDDKWKDSTTGAIQFMRVNSFDEQGVELKIFGTVKPATQWAMAGDFRKLLHEKFQKHHITMPVTQVNLQNRPQPSPKNR
jgi:small conductance mechanosensitive channel